jgi:hypothetical protein
MSKHRARLPKMTSGLLELQERLSAELGVRLSGIFKRYRGLAFCGRNDVLFAEHWTPDVAASGYDFEGYEIKGDEIFLHGVENSCGFVYRISIAFPVRLIDDPSQVEAYFAQQYATAKSRAALPAWTVATNAGSAV